MKKKILLFIISLLCGVVGFFTGSIFEKFRSSLKAEAQYPGYLNKFGVKYPVHCEELNKLKNSNRLFLVDEYPEDSILRIITFDKVQSEITVSYFDSKHQQVVDIWEISCDNKNEQ